MITKFDVNLETMLSCRVKSIVSVLKGHTHYTFLKSRYDTFTTLSFTFSIGEHDHEREAS